MAAEEKTRSQDTAVDSETDERVKIKVTSEPEKQRKKKKSLKQLEARCETAEQEAKDNYDRFLRISAEFENYKKRSAREISDFRKFANESLIKDMLPVVDNLERAIASSPENGDSENGIVEGVQMTLAEILKVFERHVVKQVEALGKPFDPALHQAVAQIESETAAENTVIEELQKGYMLHDRLLRPAMVVVAKGKKTETHSIMDKPDVNTSS